MFRTEILQRRVGRGRGRVLLIPRQIILSPRQTAALACRARKLVGQSCRGCKQRGRWIVVLRYVKTIRLCAAWPSWISNTQDALL